MQDSQDTILKRFSRNLNLILDAAGYPDTKSGRQIRLAEDFNVSPTAARKWLFALSLPEMKTLIAMSERYNRSIGELLGQETRPMGKSISIPILGGEGTVSVVQFEAEWLNKEMRVNEFGVHMLICNGDSMATTINNGEIMFVDTPVPQIDDNAIYLLRFQNRIMVRRIRLGFSNQAELICDNASYQSSQYPLDKIHCNNTNEIDLGAPQQDDAILALGKVLWSIKRVN